MKDEAFKDYLLNSYPKDLSAKYVRDCLSNCRRVERDLEIDLDQVNDLSSFFLVIDQRSYSEHVKASLRRALNRYQDFKSQQ